MKKYIYLFAVLALGITTFTSCDLDKFPEGDVFTDSQKEDLVGNSPDRLAADVNGLASGLNRALILDSEPHFDYGFPAVCLILESNGQDLWAAQTGYNWFSGPQAYNDRTVSSEETEFIWKTFYNHIKTANDVLQLAPEDTQDPILKGYRGQALANRAFDYFHLIQIYQFTYKGNENKAGVPLILEPLAPLGYDNPRATVEEVYKQIMKDLDEAIILLADYSRSDKARVSLEVAYGLRARVNLVMENWSAAASDAKKAQSGFTPASLEEVSTPGFNSVNSNNWMWGSIITPQDDVVKTGILNWPSHLCSLTLNGYSLYVPKSINRPLWNDIPQTDIRRDWFLRSEKVDTVINKKDTIIEVLKSKLIDDMKIDYKGNLFPVNFFFTQVGSWDELTNVKFHAYQNIPGNSTNSSDWPLMRVEEMILVEAEALAMSGDVAGGKKVLEDFVKTYRNPEFKSNASSPEELQEEVWFQRRLELWGEGFSFYDLKRLKKPVTRVKLPENESSYPSAVRFNIEADNDVLLYMIPESEVNVNAGIDKAENNPAGVVPDPIAPPIKD